MILEKEKFRVLYNKNNMIIVKFICDLLTLLENSLVNYGCLRKV